MYLCVILLTNATFTKQRVVAIAVVTVSFLQTVLGMGMGMNVSQLGGVRTITIADIILVYHHIIFLVLPLFSLSY